MPNLLTNKEVFDRVKIHLLTQNKKCYIEPVSIGGMCTVSGCRYFNADENTYCAIGILLVDFNIYDLDMEGSGIFYIKSYFDLSIFENINTDLLVDLQIIHDSYETIHWKDELEKVAIKYRMSPHVRVDVHEKYSTGYAVIFSDFDEWFESNDPRPAFYRGKEVIRKG